MNFSEASIYTVYNKKPKEESLQEREDLEFSTGDSSCIDVARNKQWRSSSNLNSLLQNDFEDTKQKSHQSKNSIDCKEEKEKKILATGISIKTFNISTNHYERLGEHLKKLWEQNHITDVIVKVENERFAAHKSVLTCYCPFLKRHLLDKEKQNIQKIELQNVDPDSFKILLNYMYTGQINVTCQNLSDIYRAARILQMKNISEYCKKMLTNQNDGTSTNIFLYTTAKKLGIQETYQRAFNIVLQNFDKVSNKREFLNLDVDSLCELLCADKIGTYSEKDVFLCSLKWLNHRFIEREKYTVKVMSCIRFPLMTMEEILSCYNPPILPEIVEFPEVANMLLKATCFIAASTKGKETKFKEFSCSPRFFLYRDSTIQKYDEKKNANRKLYVPSKYENIRRIIIKIQSVFRGYAIRRKLEEKAQKEFLVLKVQAY
ncbi:kelch repeat and BTB domain-containing protein 8-like [Centruroides vittatus]|uniref:kelch repeat and BTB domain-containing protein 8-like n=1 Tax=Centruroides vittatus TaxID=120091 RepID=UPI00350FFCF9